MFPFTEVEFERYAYLGGVIVELDTNTIVVEYTCPLAGELTSEPFRIVDRELYALAQSVLC